MNVVNQNLNQNPFAAKEGPGKPSAAAAQRPIAAAESGMPAEASAAAAADGTAETASAAFVEIAAPLGEQAGQTAKPGKFQPSSVKDFNNQSMGEEIANAISHGVGAALAIAGTVVMIVCASVYSDAMGVVCGCLYGFSFTVEDEIAFGCELLDGLAHQVEGTQRVLKAGVLCTGIDNRRKSYLLDTV